MRKVEIDWRNVGHPMPMALLGTQHEGRVNFMALAWHCRVNVSPPQVAVSVGRSAASAAAIAQNGCFGLSFPSHHELETTDYLGMVSGRSTDKSGILPVFYGECDAAPMADGCPVAMECRLAETLELPTSTLFVGDVVKVYADEECLAEGRVDLRKTDPLLLSMPDNRYWSLGAPAEAKAWSAGSRLRASTNPANART